MLFFILTFLLAELATAENFKLDVSSDSVETPVAKAALQINDAEIKAALQIHDAEIKAAFVGTDATVVELEAQLAALEAQLQRQVQDLGETHAQMVGGELPSAMAALVEAHLEAANPKKKISRIDVRKKHRTKKCITLKTTKNAKDVKEAKAGSKCLRGVDQRELPLLGGCIFDRKWGGKNGWCWTKRDMSEWGMCSDCSGSSLGFQGQAVGIDRSQALSDAKEPVSRVWIYLGGGMVAGVVFAVASTYGAFKLRPDMFGPRKGPEGDHGVGRFTVNRIDGGPAEIDGESTLKLTNQATMMNLLTMLIGAGVLAFPNAVEACGWVLAPFMIAFACGVNFIVCTILLDVIERCETKGSLITEMKHIERALFGSDLFTDLCTMAFLFALCAAYLVLMAENLDFIMPGDKKLYILLAGGITGALALIKDVSVISKLSVIGVVASALYVVCITTGSIQANSTYEPEHRIYTMGPPSVGSLPMVLCIMLFGFNCQYALPAVRADMQAPLESRKVVFQAHAVVGSIYLFVGLIGYWGWGTRVGGNVLLSMCEAPGCEPPEGVLPGTTLFENFEGGRKMAVGKILACAVVSNLIVSLPLSTNILFVVLEHKYAQIRDSQLINLVMREGLIVAMIVAAILCPFFKEMLGLISSVLVVMLGMILPVSFAIKMDRDEGLATNYKNVALLILGAVCLVLGTKGAIEELMLVMTQNAGGPGD